MIDRLNQLIQGVTRASAISNTQPRAGSGAAVQGAGASPAGNSTPTPGAFAPSLRDRLVQRVQALEPDDPRWRRQALRALVEVQLLGQFGERLANDAGFQQIVDDVAAQIDQDPQLQTDVLGALDQLLASGKPG